jgi:hypothetical protein
LSGAVFHPDVNCIFFGEKFNQGLDNVIFPQKLISVYFGFDFNQPIDNVRFPNSLLTLSLGPSFNQPIDNVKILDTIDTIEFGERFNQSLSNIKFSNLAMCTVNNNNILPTLNYVPQLIYIKFNLGFSIPFSDAILPNTIQHIIFSELSSSLIDFNKITFPSSLKNLCLPTEQICIICEEKMHITRIGIYNWDNLNNLPDGLEELTVWHVSKTITNLPLSLKKIFIKNTQSNLSHFTKLPFGCQLYDINTQHILNIELAYNDSIKLMSLMKN